MRLINNRRRSNMDDSLERKEGNATYEVTIVVGNLQEHQLDSLSDFIGKLESNGVNCQTFEIQND